MSTKKIIPSMPNVTGQFGIGGGRGTIPVFSRPDLVLDGAGGIGMYTPFSTLAGAGHTLAVVAQQDITFNAQRQQAVAAQNGIALFTLGKAQDPQRTVQDTGIKLHAASGKVSVQAQAGQARLNADQAVSIASTGGGITITAPDSILLTGGGSYLKIEGGNIELGTSGAAEFKAAMKELAGAQGADAAVSLPKAARLKSCAEAIRAAAGCGLPFVPA